MTHALASFLRVTSSMALALPLSVLLGYYCSKKPGIDRLFCAFMPIPKLAFLPVIMLIFGVGEVSKIIFLLLFGVFLLTDALKNALKNVDINTWFLLKKGGADAKFLFFELYFPAILPTIFSATGSLFSQCFAVLVLAEGYGSCLGLGFFMIDSFLKFRYTHAIFAVVISSFLGCIGPILSKLAVRKLCQWI